MITDAGMASPYGAKCAEMFGALRSTVSEVITAFEEERKPNRRNKFPEKKDKAFR